MSHLNSTSTKNEVYLSEDRQAKNLLVLKKNVFSEYTQNFEKFKDVTLPKKYRTTNKHQSFETDSNDSFYDNFLNKITKENKKLKQKKIRSDIIYAEPGSECNSPKKNIPPKIDKYDIMSVLAKEMKSPPSSPKKKNSDVKEIVLEPLSSVVSQVVYPKIKTKRFSIFNEAMIDSRLPKIPDSNIDTKPFQKELTKKSQKSTKSNKKSSNFFCIPLFCK